MNKQRLQKLAGINELQIKQPFDYKKELEALLSSDEEDGMNMLDKCLLYNTLEEWKLDNDATDEIPNEVLFYYKYFKDNSYIFEVEDTSGEQNITLNRQYKYITWYGMGYNNALIILHNIKLD